MIVLAGGLGGLLGGSIYGYGSQVVRNLNQGMCFWDALSRNIDAGQVALYAGVGTILGLGMGGGIVGINALVGYLSTIGFFGPKILQNGNVLSQIERYGIQTAKQLKNAIQGTGLQVHYLIEQRLAPALNQTAAQTKRWMSIAVTPAEHQLLTNAWRKAIGYINSTNPVNTSTATINDIWVAAQKIYADYPAVLDAIKSMLGFH